MSATDPSKSLREHLTKELAAVEAEARRTDDQQRQLHKGAKQHDERMHGASERLRAGLGHADFDSEDAVRYEGVLRDRKRAALTHSHLERTLGES